MCTKLENNVGLFSAFKLRTIFELFLGTVVKDAKSCAWYLSTFFLSVKNLTVHNWVLKMSFPQTYNFWAPIEWVGPVLVKMPRCTLPEGLITADVPPLSDRSREYRVPAGRHTLALNIKSRACCVPPNEHPCSI